MTTANRWFMRFAGAILLTGFAALSWEIFRDVLRDVSALSAGLFVGASIAAIGGVVLLLMGAIWIWGRFSERAPDSGKRRTALAIALFAMTAAIWGFVFQAFTRVPASMYGGLLDDAKRVGLIALWVVLTFSRLFSPRRSRADRGSRDVQLRRSFLAIAKAMPELEQRGNVWRSKEGATVRVEEPSHLVLEWLPAAVSIVPKVKGSPGLRTGDPTFDEQFQVDGLAIESRARLGADARQRFRALAALAPGLRLEEGTLHATVPPEFRDPRGLESLLRAALSFATAFGGDAGLERLAKVARTDPSPGVRLRALEEIASLETGAAIVEEALTDSDPAVRLFAAQRVGERGREVMARIAENPAVPDSVRVEAFRGARALPREQFQPLLLRSLADPNLALRAAAVVAAEALRWPVVVPQLCLIANGAALPLAIAVAKALGAIGAAAGEPALISLLGHRDAEARLAAIGSLASMGGAASVEPLRAVAGGALSAGEQRTAALEAIERIQARLVGADAGQLTVATEGGELSEANGVGAVSIARARTPQRS